MMPHSEPLTRAAQVLSALDDARHIEAGLLAELDDCQREYEAEQRLCARMCPARFAALARQANMERQSA